MFERQTSYFSSIFTLLKTAAFHQIYMESAREDLCKDQNYDPLTAFKALDCFKHNKVVPYELFSFFQLHKIQSTVEECQQVICALNKEQWELDWEMFQEMTLPHNIVLRNLALTRFNNLRIDVGTYSRLTYVREHTHHLVALFLEKELNFCRQFLFLRQEFMRQWGGDVYTMLQKLFRNHKQSKSINFQEFYETAREFAIYFNKSEFRAIWRRCKKRKEKIEEVQNQKPLEFQQIVELLLSKDFKTKSRYGLQQNVSIQKSMQSPAPSYKVSHWRQYEEEKKKDQLVKLDEVSQSKTWHMKYSFSYPHLMSPDWDRRERANKLSQQVNQMNDAELQAAYRRVTQRRTPLRN